MNIELVISHADNPEAHTDHFFTSQLALEHENTLTDLDLHPSDIEAIDQRWGMPQGMFNDLCDWIRYGEIDLGYSALINTGLTRYYLRTLD